ncbi:hypothetical protein ACMD2_10814 [Ananas comosus]|uniref:C3HC-type domain-containing protein n=1 Tax=Ananas comosus TaxID=4615 RepID=A0A199VRQ9_ANACO|nr:hypothetical protein ACMD2_10814 [Ananas comosus]
MALGDSEKRLQKVMDKLYHFPKPKPSTSSSVERGKKVVSGPRFGFERGLRVPSAATAIAMLGPAPPCRPWDRGDLLRRLATFKAMTWFGKPKAAAVFSLKLDTGHKLLCPWIDNICDEVLAMFPPSPPPVLVESYNERSSSLMRLVALPVVSSSAIEYMKRRSPQLDPFLKEPSHLSVLLRGGIKIADGFRSKDLDGVVEDATAELYCQALKITSLCGWEPRLLPYAVDSSIKSGPSTNATSISEPSEKLIHEQNKGITVYASHRHGEVEGEECDNPMQRDYQYDPSSVVLDCKFCGARVALWAFSMVDRPLLLFNFIADSSSQGEADARVDQVSGIGALRPGSSGLSLTIAGGPSPTKQKFRPRVSFPVVSRHLRAELSSSRSILSLESRNLNSDDILNHQKSVEGDPGILDGSGSPKLKRSRDEFQYGSTNVNASSSTIGELNGEKTGALVTTNVEGSMSSNPNTVLTDKNAEENQSEPVTRSEFQHEEGENHASRLENLCHGKSESSHDGSINTTSSSVINPASTDNKNHEEGEKNFNIQNPVDEIGSNQKTTEFTKMVALSSDKESDTNQASGKAMLWSKMNEFDPIKQHRVFCPWIAPDDGEHLPGWKLTLLALVSQEKEKEKASTSHAEVETHASLLDEVDDPVASVRKLFMSPPPKRRKSAH